MQGREVLPGSPARPACLAPAGESSVFQSNVLGNAAAVVEEISQPPLNDGLFQSSPLEHAGFSQLGRSGQSLHDGLQIDKQDIGQNHCHYSLPNSCSLLS